MIALTLCLYLMALTIFFVLTIVPTKQYPESIDYQKLWTLIAWLLLLIGNLIQIVTT